MNIATVQFMSEALGRHVTYSVILPTGEAWKKGGDFPILYQLHGRSDDHTAWLNFSNLVLHAGNLPFIIVLPDGGISFWSDYSPHERYEAFIIQDLDTHVRRTFPARPGKAAIGGLSMGGYGAMALGLKYPDRFASIWAHSSAFFDEARFRSFEYPPQDPKAMDIFAIAERLKGQDALPVISFDCGRDDFLIEENRRFHEHLTALGIAHTYKEHEGAHTWSYWDLHVREALAQHKAVLLGDDEA